MFVIAPEYGILTRWKRKKPSNRELLTPMKLHWFHFPLFLMGWGLQAEAATQPLAADTVVERLHGTLIRVMENADKLGYTGRYQTLKPVVDDSFDFGEISRIVLGRYWRRLDNDQQTEFVNIFRELSTATYASRFDSYSGERFRQVAKEPFKGERLLLRTELVKQNGETIPFLYVLQPQQEKWLIINVVADGVSDLSLKKAEYASVMKREGFQHLVAKLREKIEEYENPNKQ
ncbi:MAG: ABC transporter substrate-binding protein [Gammaproteobacteria bacterium]